MGSEQEVQAHVPDNRYMRDQRLLHARDFGRVFEQTELRVSARNFLFLGRINATGCARLGLVVSKKKVGNAVRRNRVKRLCREVFRARAKNLASIDIVIVARVGLNELDNQTLIRLLNKSFDQLTQQHSENAVKKGSTGQA